MIDFYCEQRIWRPTVADEAQHIPPRQWWLRSWNGKWGVDSKYHIGYSGYKHKERKNI